MSHVVNSSILPPWIGYRSIAVLPSPPPGSIFIHLAPDVHTEVDLTLSTWQTTIDPLDNAIGPHNTYPLDSDLSSGKCYTTFEQPGAWLKKDKVGQGFLCKWAKVWVRGQLKFQITLLVHCRWQIRILEWRGQKQYCFNLLVYLVNLLDKWNILHGHLR